MTVRVLHVTCSSLAGAPIRIVRALQKYTDVSVRLLNLTAYSKRICDEDLLWEKEEHKKEALDLIREADIIHFHHPFDFRSENNPFGFNIAQIAKKTVKYLRHFHSDPTLYKRQADFFNDFNDNETLPHVVIPHYPERYYPNARVVPNIIPIHDPEYLPLKTNNEVPIVSFSPSSFLYAFEDRWGTKSCPEVEWLCRKFERKKIARLDMIYNVPLTECLRRKQASDIVIDDVNTGSYHLSALEGLSLGKPTFAYLDSRTITVLLKLTGASEIPFINVSLEYLEKPLLEIIDDRRLREDIGFFSRQWIERYYRDDKLVFHFVAVYKDLMNGMQNLNEGRNFEFERAKAWLRVGVNDHIWKAREKMFSYKSYLIKVYKLFGKALRALKHLKKIFIKM